MSTNGPRIKSLSTRPRVPKYAVGQLVREPYGEVGAIDVIYADLEAAIELGVIDPQWYDDQSRRPRTPKGGIWYNVIIPEGAVVVGEDDLQEASS